MRVHRAAQPATQLFDAPLPTRGVFQQMLKSDIRPLVEAAKVARQVLDAQLAELADDDARNSGRYLK